MTEKEKEKLEFLRNSDLTLYKWTAGQRRLAGNLIPLSELRFNVLICRKGSIRLSISAPLVYLSKGRPVMSLYDRDVVLILSGKRAGINVLRDFVLKTEQFTEARSVVNTEVTENSGALVLRRVLSMSKCASYPVGKIKFPEIVRVTRTPEAIRPIYNAEMLRYLGAGKSTTTEELNKKFLENISRFAEKTDSGYIFSNSIVAHGGCTCVRDYGIHRDGSAVFRIADYDLMSEIEDKKLNILKEIV